MISLRIHAYVSAESPEVMHSDDVLPHSQYKVGMNTALSQSLGDSQVQENLNFKMVRL